MADLPKFKFSGPDPKYKQVAAHLRERIRQSELKVGDSLGDIFRLADYYGCSIGTVSSAERLLVTEGVLSAIQPGKPTLVVALPEATEQDATISRLRKLRHELDVIIADLENDAA